LRIEFARVATPGVWITDLLRTGTYIERSEFARLIEVLGGFGGGFAGFELFHVVSVITLIVLCDMVVTFSNAGSSSRFSNLFAS